MTISSLSTSESEDLQAQREISRWNNEGGAYPDEEKADIPKLTNAELVHLRVRVVR